MVCSAEEGIAKPDPAIYRLAAARLDLPQPPARLLVHVSADQRYLLHVNGQRVGEDLLTPGWTSYNKRLQYQVFCNKVCFFNAPVNIADCIFIASDDMKISTHFYTCKSNWVWNIYIIQCSTREPRITYAACSIKL